MVKNKCPPSNFYEIKVKFLQFKTEFSMVNYKHFVGIDISKHKLDVVLLCNNILISSYVMPNELREISSFIKKLKATSGVTIKNTVFGMEHTGIYSQHLLTVLTKIGANIVIDSAYHIKQSLGLVRDKTDFLDALRIAQYVYKNRENLRFWIPKREVLIQLKYLSSLRWGLISAKISLKNPIKERDLFFDKKMKLFQSLYAKPSIYALDQEIIRTEKAISDLVKSDEKINYLFTLVTSVPCIGPVTALEIIITSNEFINFSDPRKFACYAGLAPFKRESGTVSFKMRVSKIANQKIKALLTICAFTATRSIPDIKEYYRKKTKDEGKAKMSVINAVRNKLILRIFACVNENRVYQETWLH
ncbi:transposase [Mucilaginibacter agri]|uniref:Transposase n=1 Tax=Mucilaginibacter agri TaxID=2695265 RepID=A0A966DQ95_9SPHI|nr:transposase [Mucilaginibacter agri]NCD67823.1 transposase [Mucilaginibacter agri]